VRRPDRRSEGSDSTRLYALRQAVRLTGVTSRGGYSGPATLVQSDREFPVDCRYVERRDFVQAGRDRLPGLKS
jgi:hypothetical protein